MTVIHVHHLNCNECNHHYRAYALLSYYDNGEGKAPNPNSEMYDKKCPMCLSQNYSLIKDYEYDLEGAQEAIDLINQLEFKSHAEE